MRSSLFCSNLFGQFFLITVLFGKISNHHAFHLREHHATIPSNVSNAIRVATAWRRFLNRKASAIMAHNKPWKGRRSFHQIGHPRVSIPASLVQTPTESKRNPIAGRAHNKAPTIDGTKCAYRKATTDSVSLTSTQTANNIALFVLIPRHWMLELGNKVGQHCPVVTFQYLL